MAKQTDHQSKIVALVRSAKDVEVTTQLSFSLPGTIKELHEPELSVLEVRAAALKDEICVDIVILVDTYYVAADSGLVQKASNVSHVTRLLRDEGIDTGYEIEITAEVMLLGSWIKEQEEYSTRLSGACKLTFSYHSAAEKVLTFPGSAGLDGAAMEYQAEVETIQGHFAKTIDLSLPLEFSSMPDPLIQISGYFTNQHATPLWGWVKIEGEIVVVVPSPRADNALTENFVYPVKYFVEVSASHAKFEAYVTGDVNILACKCEPETKKGLLRGFIVLEGTLKCVETLAVAVNTRAAYDAQYTPHKNFQMEEVVSSGSSQTLIERELYFNRPVRLVREPIGAHVRNLHHEIIPNKVIVRGILHKQLYVVDAINSTVFLHEVDERFVHFVDVPGAAVGMRAHVQARVEYARVDIHPDRVSARQVTIIEIMVKVKKVIKKGIIVKPPHYPDHHGAKPMPAGRVYIVRSGDTVWKIAQMFGVSLESIIKANNLQNPNLIFPGEKLFIPK